MIGLSGELLTKKDELDKHSVNHHKNMLQNRTIKKELEDHMVEKDELCKLRLDETKLIKIPDWTTKELMKVLKELKKNKSRDPNNYINEIFNPKVAGDDLIQAVLNLMNKIKSEGVYPSSMQLCNITSI